MHADNNKTPRIFHECIQLPVKFKQSFLWCIQPPRRFIQPPIRCLQTPIKFMQTSQWWIQTIQTTTHVMNTATRKIHIAIQKILTITHKSIRQSLNTYIGYWFESPLTCRCSCGSRTLGTNITGNAPGVKSKQDAGVPGGNTA